MNDQPIALPAAANYVALVVKNLHRQGGPVSFYGVKLHRSDVLQLSEHPDACTEENFADWCATRTTSGARLAVDLFSGAGGLSLGLEQAGWTVAASVDADLRALQTHRANFPGLALNVDLGDQQERDRLISLLNTAQIDLVAGGPPCQPFSRAGRSKIRSLVELGRRDANDERKQLWKAFVDVVLKVRPRAVLMENVPDMALGDDFSVVRRIVHELETSGYFTEIQLVDAWKHGVPQHRKRLIVLARLDSDRFPWPDTDSIPNVHLREAIGDLPVLPEDPEDELAVGARRMAYTTVEDPPAFVSLMRKEVAEADIIHDHMTRPVRSDDLEIFRLMDHRTLYSDIPEELRRYDAKNYDDKYKRLDWDNYSRSVTAHIAKDGYWYIHPEQHRTLTVREAARIQTFPDSFRFAGTRSDAFRQIGNAVPPLLGKSVASALKPDERGIPTRNMWLDLHRELTKWGRAQSQKQWFLYPEQGRASASLVSLLRPERDLPTQLPAALEEVRNKSKILKTDLENLKNSPGITEKWKNRLDRFNGLTSKRNIWKDDDDIVEALELKTSEEELFRLLRGNNIMLTSQASLRVALRVVRGETEMRNRLTDGRVNLARILGGGEDAPIRMAAIRQIGLTNCLPSEPLCFSCPLQKWCRFSETEEHQRLL
ncbi:DNA cytosine methyltransferase [Nocardiopsis alba]|uniref:DNA cytosine methyltransferase n=1 Tax=Nocardiopsis alba TaxID=53437 RepID=UPI003631A245